MGNVPPALRSLHHYLRVIRAIRSSPGNSPTIFPTIRSTLRLDISPVLLLRWRHYLALVQLGGRHVVADCFLFSLLHVLRVGDHYVVEVLHRLLE